MTEQRADGLGVGAAQEEATAASASDSETANVMLLKQCSPLDIERKALVEEVRHDMAELRQGSMALAGSLLERCREAEAAELEASRAQLSLQHEVAELREQLANSLTARRALESKGERRDGPLSKVGDGLRTLGRKSRNLSQDLDLALRGFAAAAVSTVKGKSLGEPSRNDHDLVEARVSSEDAPGS